MILDKNSFYSEVNNFKCLPGKIETISKESFEKVYGSEEARKDKKIVYMFLAENPIPRLVGASRIIYIGQTKNSFKTRYFQWAHHHASTEANEFKFKEIVKGYGTIQVAVAPYSRYGNTLLKAEGQLLWWYFQNHAEYPPLNYTKTKVRTGTIEA